MKNEELYAEMIKKIHSTTKDKGSQKLLKNLQSKDEYKEMEAYNELSGFCKSVAKKTINQLSPKEQFEFVDFLLEDKIPNLKTLDKIFKNDTSSISYGYNWLELHTCDACIACKNQIEVKKAKKDKFKRKIEEIKSTFGFGKDKN